MHQYANGSDEVLYPGGVSRETESDTEDQRTLIEMGFVRDDFGEEDDKIPFRASPMHNGLTRRPPSLQTFRQRWQRWHRPLTNRIPPKHRRLLLRAAFFLFLFLPLFMYICLAYLVPTSPSLVPTSVLQSSSVLLVVAHPDDECLFFSPTLNRIHRSAPDTKLSILVMSVGTLH